MFVKEKHDVIIEYYPFADSIKEKILSDSSKFPLIREKYNWDGGLTNVRALQMEPIDHPDQNFSSVNLLFDWILTLVRNQKYIKSQHLLFKIDHFWIANYEKGDFTIPHHHHPSHWSFVYFLNSPKGSSPLVFTTSGKKIKAEDGKVVIFAGEVLHHVPKNKCDGRIVLAGNLTRIIN